MKNASEGTTPHNASSTGVATTGGTPTPERLTPGDPALATGSATRSLLNGGGQSHGRVSRLERTVRRNLRTRLAPLHPTPYS